ncbi:MAG: hypothetical protein FWD87_07975 [Spirochaetaceae bacterium]|nr:hypothetical protein [Spirochaetaceae bacterium]
MRIRNLCLMVLLLFILTPVLYAQSDEQRFGRRIFWQGTGHVLHYAVEIERQDRGTYRSHLREFTTLLHLDVSLPLGEYRFRIIPYDILGRSVEGTEWIYFVVRPGLDPEITEGVQVISGERGLDIDSPYRAPATIRWERRSTRRVPRWDNRFNTLGISFGTSFTEPLLIATLHGTYSPVRNFYIELGCDVGFLSADKDINDYFSIYPFGRLGFFLPFEEGAGFFIGAGGGYQIANYTIGRRRISQDVFKANFNTGLVVADFLIISYTLLTDFRSTNNKISVGYIYRF